MNRHGAERPRQHRLLRSGGLVPVYGAVLEMVREAQRTGRRVETDALEVAAERALEELDAQVYYANAMRRMVLRYVKAP